MKSGGVKSRRVFTFGPFSLDASESLLRREEAPVAVTPKAVQLLGALVSARGNVVGKEALLSSVWPGVFVGENTLSKHVSMLRKALGAGYIQTISRRGYRFTAPVNERAAIAEAGLPGRLRTIAVLPLQNVGADPEIDYLCDGLTEQLIDCLCAVPELRVMARSTVFRYKGRHVDPRRLGRELPVDVVLCGGLKELEGTFQFAAELCETESGFRIWGTQLHREAGAVSEIPHLLADGIVRALLKKPPAKDLPPLPAKSGAYHHYLKGLYHFNKRTPPAILLAIEDYRRAVSADPQFPLAHIGLARCFGALPRPLVGIQSPAQVRPMIETAIEKALQLDPTLPEAYVERACLKARYDWDWTGSDEEFRRALELNPRNLLTHQVYSQYLGSLGRFEESQRELDLALDSDPLSVMLRTDQAFLFFLEKRYDEAIAQCLDTLEMDPDSAQLHVALGLCYQEQGASEIALGQHQLVADRWGDSPVTTALQAYNLGRMGNTTKARRLAQEMVALSAKRYVSAFDIAVAHLGASDTDGFFTWLRRACDERSYGLVLLPVYPFEEHLRRDARFKEIVALTGLGSHPSRS